MPASEFAYPSSDPEGHPATRSTIEVNGRTFPKAEIQQLGRTAQLSEYAHGEGDVEEKSFTPPPSKVEPTHAFERDS